MSRSLRWRTFRPSVEVRIESMEGGLPLEILVIIGSLSGVGNTWATRLMMGDMQAGREGMD